MLAIYPALVLLTAAVQAVPFTLDRLELDLRVDHENERVDGTARLTVRNVSSAPASEVPLLLNRLMTVKGAGGLPFTQDVVLFEDDDRWQADAVTVRLASPLAPRESATIAVDYGGHVAGYQETGCLYIRDRVSEEYTIIREDAFSFPVLGVRSTARNRTIRHDGFTFDARVTVAAGFTVAAGGFAGREDSAGRSTFRFASHEPVPFLNLCIARFATLAGKGYTLAYLPSDEEGARRIFQKTGDALALLANWLGPPPANAPKIAIVEIPAGWGSQADRLAGIILTADSFHDPSRLQDLYHELAHLWNPPDLDRPSPRWNEGLGRWIQELVAQELDGEKPSAARTVARVLGPDDERLARVPLASYGTEGMTDWSYSVGRLYFQLFEELVGRAPLLAAIRDLGQERRAKGATLCDLTMLLEARFPDAAAVDADWIWSAGWRSKLAEKGSVEALAVSYRAQVRPGP